MSVLNSMYVVSTRKPKGKRFNMKISESLRQEFTAASEIIGLRMSQVVHQFIVRTVNEIREKHPDQFNLVLSQIKEQEAIEAPTNKAEEAKRTATQNFALLKSSNPNKEELSIMDIAKLLSKETGEEITVTHITNYKLYIGSGDTDFLSYLDHIQEIIKSYYENGSGESLQAPIEDAG